MGTNHYTPIVTLARWFAHTLTFMRASLLPGNETPVQGLMTRTGCFGITSGITVLLHCFSLFSDHECSSTFFRTWITSTVRTVKLRSGGLIFWYICVVNCDEWKGESGGSEGVVVTPHECSCSACAWYASPWLPGFLIICSHAALASSNYTSVLIQFLVCKPLCGSICRCHSSPLPPPLAQIEKFQCPVRYNVLIMIVTLSNSNACSLW